MSKYKPVKIGIEWTIFRKDGKDMRQTIPIRYYKTKSGALKAIKKRLLNK